MQNTIGENTRRLRIQKGTSQDRLSKDSDLALNTIVKIETGDNPNPTVETLQSIAKALNVSVSSLFVLPLKSLKDLEREKLVKLPSGFGGFFSGMDLLETAHSKMFLKRLEPSNDNKALSVVVETTAKNELSASIRSENGNLLKEIQNVLETKIGKSVSDIYHEKIIIYE